jgi:hypothetical protein
MKAIIIHKNAGTIDNGIYLDVRESGNDLSIGIPMIERRWVIWEHEIISYIPLTVRGKTYEERKTDLTEKAIEWSNAGSAANWSYGELVEIEHFFRTNGKRYGLIREFQENAII